MTPTVLLRRDWLQGRRHGAPRSRTHGTGAVILSLLVLYVAHSYTSPNLKHAVPDVAFMPIGQEMLPLFGALALGTLLYFLKGNSLGCETVSILLIYFGAQTGMNLYMKNVLSKIVVDEEEGLKGVPIGFLLTVTQQFVAFAIFCIVSVVSKMCGSGYEVKKLTTKKEYIAVICFSMAFAANIGLNNFGLSLVAVSVNMLIRSCLPLSTAISQIAVGSVMGLGKKNAISSFEWLLMLAGVGCAGLATIAKSQCTESTEESKALVLGVIVCVVSIFSGALNMVLAGVLGSEMKLNPVETTCYMSLPAGFFLLGPALLIPHPVGTWKGFDLMTDWQVLREVLARNPAVLLPVLFSGVLAFCYNILQYSLVHKLSASYAAFAGNFNKAATVALSLVFGLESLPSGNWGYLFLAAVAGNILAFTLFSANKVSKK